MLIFGAIDINTYFGISFGKKNPIIESHSKMLLDRGNLAINPKFGKLIPALRTAVDNEGTLDKEATSYNDIFDAYRLVFQNYAHPSN